jgi:predicted phage gp36 major capsid-like protein
LSKDEQIIISVPAELKAEFQQAAEILDRSAAQILRDCMCDFVAKNEIITASISARSTVDERQAAVSFGRASVALEGFAVSSAAEAQQQRWVRGEISMEECIADIKQAHQGE